MTVDNAIIMAAGTSSRFAPLSYEHHKAMTVVRGEVLIERQIRQLKEAGISDIYIVTGYKEEEFLYLKDKYNVSLIHNPDYISRNNNSSIWAARDVIRNSYICSSDNYFLINPFESEVECSYYSAVYTDKETNEWCIESSEDGLIKKVTIGGKNAWYMLGHTFWDSSFTERFLDILKKEYNLPNTADKLWESVYIDHISELPMKIRKYPEDSIYEFDTLDDLRIFDYSFIEHSGSAILSVIASDLRVSESDIAGIKAVKDSTTEAVGFEFDCNGKRYRYRYNDKKAVQIS